jgi:hypothetical protein
MRRPLAALLTVFAFLSPPLAAQRAPAPLFAQAALAIPKPVYPAADFPTDDFDDAKAVTAGIFGTLAGFAVGGGLGHQFDRQPCDFCIEFALLGAFVGASVGAPYAVHLSNGRRGRLGPAVLASLAIGLVGGLGGAAATHDARVLLAVPILQIASAVAIEHRTADE